MGKLYDEFHRKAEMYTNLALEDINDELHYLNIQAVITGYDFTDINWLAVYVKSGGAIQDDIIEIGVNYPLLFSEMKKRRIHQDDFNIEAQCRINIGHEAAHGIIDWLRCNIDGDEIEPESELYEIYYCDEDEEEEIAEEYGRYCFPEATGVYVSRLADVLPDVHEYIVIT